MFKHACFIRFRLVIYFTHDVNMNKRQDSLISLANSETNDLSGADTDSEEPIIMRWVSSGNQMLTRALSRKAKESRNGNKNRLSYTEQQSDPEFVHNGNKNRLSYREQSPCDPRIAKLKEKLQEKEKLLYQLEKQENDFLGKDNHNEDTTILRIEFEATICKDYYLVPGCSETLIPAGKTVAIFGQLRNKRWRCVVENDDRLNNNGKNDTERSSDQSRENDKQFPYCYPLIGSIPSSIITELNEGANTDTVLSEDTYLESLEDTNSSLCECGRRLPLRRRNSHSKNPSCSLCQYCTYPLPMAMSPIKTITPEHLEELKFERFPPVSSLPLPSLPESPTESTIAELNMALESLAKITPRSRPVSDASAIEL